MLDENKIVLFLLNWSYSTIEIHVCVRMLLGGGAFFQLGKPQLIEEFCWTNQMSYSCLVWIVFISFHVGLMK